MKNKKPSAWGATHQGDALRTPVNPLTGRPNEPGAPDPADPARTIEVRAFAGDSGKKSDSYGGPAVTGSPAASAAPGSAASPAADASQAGAGPAAQALAGSTGEGAARPSRAVAPDWLRGLFNSRLVAFIVLLVLAFTLLSESFLLFVAVLFGGYVLIDRFLDVRHAVLIGGTAWGLTMLFGQLVYSAFPFIYLDFRWVFVFLGFVVCVAACGLFFLARSAYVRGEAVGRAEADKAIARHLVERLIEKPDDWSDLDSAYLEVEAALNRVRARERMSEQALRDEARRKDDLVTYLAHDLKTPLASVVGYLSLLNEAPDLPAEQRVRFTGVALDKAHRLDALIEEFFDITRFDFHDIVLTRGYVDLNLMLAQVADEFYPTLAEQRKTVELNVPLGLTVLVDGDKMARVFNNVMKNAIAYSYEGTAIRVDAQQRAEDGATVIRFENRGDPIPKAKLDVIFEKFYRLDAARATNRGGAGLGLAIAKEIVTAHGGTISCASDAEHTVFTIVLPA